MGVRPEIIDLKTVFRVVFMVSFLFGFTLELAWVAWRSYACKQEHMRNYQKAIKRRCVWVDVTTDCRKVDFKAGESKEAAMMRRFFKVGQKPEASGSRAQLPVAEASDRVQESEEEEEDVFGHGGGIG